MRIALICPYSFAVRGGVQNHVLGLARWLRAHGHQPGILAPDAPHPDVLADHGLTPDDFTSSGRAMGVRYNGSVARINFGPLTHARVGRWLDQFDPGVVHLHEPITPSAALLGLWQSEAPVVATFHTATPGSTAMKLAGQVLAGSVGRIRGAIAVSGAARTVVREHIGIDPQVIGNGIWTANHPLTEPVTPWRGGHRPRITFLGRYNEPRKGFEVFVPAIARVLAEVNDLDVVVAGAGTPRSEPGIRFVGAIGDSERNDLLTSSDLYVAPHLGRESFGIVLIEALASGARVVASDLPAFREVLSDEDGVVGRLTHPGDVEALSSAIIATVREGRVDPARGRRIAERFDWDRVAPRIVRVYDEAKASASAEAGPRARRTIA